MNMCFGKKKCTVCKVNKLFKDLMILAKETKALCPKKKKKLRKLWKDNGCCIIDMVETLSV